jgi:hypothetical protein
MHPFPQFLLNCARWWTVLCVFTLNFINFQILFWLEAQFTAITHLPVFDTQNDLTAQRLVAELPLYQGEAQTAYLWFAAYDFVFPLVAAFALALLWAWLLRNLTWRIGALGIAWNVPLWAFFATLFDWGENIALLSVILTNGGIGDGGISAALGFKQLKLTTLTLSAVVSFLLVGVAIANKGVDSIRDKREGKPIG